MTIIVCKDGFVLTSHHDSQLEQIRSAYPDCDLKWIPDGWELEREPHEGSLYLARQVDPYTQSDHPEWYAGNRKISYPPMAEYIDGVVKDDAEQIDAYLAACREVKARFPKPEPEGQL